MKKDRYGRIPFAILAILILVFAIFSAAYMVKINRERIAEEPYITHRNKQMQDTIGKETSMLKTNAELAVVKAISEYPSANMPEIYEESKENFLNSLEPYFTVNPDGTRKKNPDGTDYTGYLTTDGFEISIFNPEIFVSTVPFLYEDTNVLGDIVEFTGPVYYRTTGSVELRINDTKTPLKAKTTIDLDRVVAGTKPFLLEKGATVEYDFYEEGLIEEIVRYLLERSLDNKYKVGWSIGTTIVRDALDIAVSMESAKAYRSTSNIDLHNYLIFNKRKIDVFDYWTSKKSLGTGDGTITIDFSKYDSPIQFRAITSVTPSSVKYKSIHSWVILPEIEIEKNNYIDKEGNKRAVVYDIWVRDGKVKYSVEEIGIYPKTRYDREIDVNFHLHFGSIKDEVFPFAMKGVQIENKDKFIDEFAKLDSRRGSIIITPKNSDSKTLDTVPGSSVEVYLDGAYIGRFKDKTIRLNKIKVGGHDISVRWEYGNGTIEAGSNRSDVSPGVIESVEVYTLPDFTGDTVFWQLVIMYANNALPGKRLYSIGKLFSDLTGYPFPKDIDTPYDYLKFIKWLDGFNKFLLSDYSKTIETGKRLAMRFMTDLIVYVANKVVKNLAKDIVQKMIGVMGQLEVVVGEEIIDQQVLTVVLSGGFVVAQYTHIIQRTVDIYVKWKGKIGVTEVELPFFAKLDIGLSLAAQFLSIIVLVLDIHAKFIKLISYCDEDMAKCVVSKIETTLRMAQSFAFLAMNIIGIATFFLKNLLGKGDWANILSGKVSQYLGRIATGIAIAVAAITIYMTLSNAISTSDYSAIFDVGDKPFEVAAFWGSVAVLGLGAAWLLGLISFAALSAAIPIAGLVILAIVMIIWVILNWDSICAWWHGTITEEEERKLEGDMGSVLEKTMKMRASLNTQDLAYSLYNARKNKAVGVLAGKISAITNDRALSELMHNVSVYSREYAKAEYEKAVHMSYARFWVLPLWRQITDFVDEEHKDAYKSEGFENTHANPLQKVGSWLTFGLWKPKEHHYWTSSIYVSFKAGHGQIKLDQTTVPSIESFLENIKPKMEWNGEASGEEVNWSDGFNEYTISKIEFKITDSRPPYGENPSIDADGTKDWSDTIKHQMDELQKWMINASRYSDRYSYVGAYPKPYNFSKEYGLLIVSKDTGFRARVTITGTGKIYLGPYDVSTPYTFEMNDTDRTRNIYITPGTYSISWSEIPTPELPLLTEGAKVKVISYASKDFESARAYISIDWSRVVRFVVEDNFANTVGIWVRTADLIDSKHTTVKRDINTIVKVREIGDIGGKENPNTNKGAYQYKNTFMMSKGQKKEVWVILPDANKHVYLKTGLDSDISTPQFDIYNDLFLSPGNDRWQYVKIRDREMEPKERDISEPENDKLRSLLEEYYNTKPITKVTEYYVDYDAKVVRNDWKVTYNFSARLWVNYVANKYGANYYKDPKTNIYYPFDPRHKAAEDISKYTYHTADEIVYYYNKELYTKENYLFFYPVYLELY